MQTTADISLVLTDPSSFRQFADPQRGIGYGGFYQLITSGLIKEIQVRRRLSERLVMVAERAHAFRDMGLLERVSQVLVSWPTASQYQTIGRYYQALCIHRFGRGDVEQAAHLLEQLALDGPLSYRIRSLRSLGANSIRRADYQSALSFYREADRLSTDRGYLDPVGTVHTQKDVAVISSLEGNHRGAVVLLENLFPIAYATRAAHPHVYYHYLNSLAVELCEVGRLEEARNVSEIVSASPFARVYPEWRETRDEIELRGWRTPRDTVSVSTKATNVELERNAKVHVDQAAPGCRASSRPGTLLFMPARAFGQSQSLSPRDSIPAEQQSARVFDLEEHRKKKMPEQPNDAPKGKHSPTEINNMSTTDLLCAIMNRISDDIGDEALGRVLSLLDEIALERKQES
ncbi:MAG TPA: hypothetical protein VLM38_09535 [Blastocatellia bacterium]|nr:hypothetical protein [Blastocatellia bacterium]